MSKNARENENCRSILLLRWSNRRDCGHGFQILCDEFRERIHISMVRILFPPPTNPA